MAHLDLANVSIKGVNVNQIEVVAYQQVAAARVAAAAVVQIRHQRLLEVVAHLQLRFQKKLLTQPRFQAGLLSSTSKNVVMDTATMAFIAVRIEMAQRPVVRSARLIQAEAAEAAARQPTRQPPPQPRPQGLG